MSKYKNATLLILAISLLTISCKTYTYDRKNPYPNMEILRYGNSQAYVFPNDTSDTLIVVIEGSGWDSVLGEKQKNIWVSVKYGAQLLLELNDSYTFLIPEKFKRQPGMIYDDDMEDRANYTAENLVACYGESINGCLAEYSFSSVVLLGTSEGAALLPLVYESINHKDKVIAMVSISFGGLSLYESYSILSTTRDGYPQEWLDMFSEVLNIYNPEKDYFPDSFTENYYELTYRWFKSIVHIRPFGYYQKLSIPVLFVHGEADFRVPVESTAYIQQNLPEKPFEYWYYPWDHQPMDKATLIQFRKDIAGWIRQVTR